MRTNVLLLLLSASCMLGILISLSEVVYKEFLGLTVILIIFFFITRKWWCFLFPLACCILFLFRTEFAELQNVSALSGEKQVVTGVIIDGPYQDGDLVTLQLSLPSQEKLPVYTVMKEYSEQSYLQFLAPGKVCTIRGTLHKPLPATNFYAFNYADYLKANTSFWRLEAEALQSISCSSFSKSPFMLLKRWRHYGIQHVKDTFPEPLQGIAGALLFGDRNYLDPDTETAYQRLGLIHLLAVSGLHVSLVSGAIFYSTIRFGLSRETAESILLLFLPGYVILTGAAPSIIRAAAMVALFLLCRKYRINVCPFRLLIIFALFLLFVNPYYILHVGFQLSFVVSGSLILSLSIMKRCPRLLLPLFITTVAQLSALPILLFHFHEISFLSFGLNLLFIPLITLVILPSVFLFFFLSLFFPNVSELLMVPVNSLLNMAHNLLDSAMTWSLFHYVPGKPDIAFLVMLTYAAFWLFCSLEKKRTQGAIFSCIFLVMAGCLPLIKPYFDSQGYITILDVGQGDSILIELPYRKAVYLIDGGGALSFPKEEWAQRGKDYDPGEQVIVPYLKARGIRTLDKLIITHGDLDHYGGLYKVSDEVRVKEVLYGEGETFKEAEGKLLHTLDAKNIPIRFVEDGDYWGTGNEGFYILSPQGDEESGNHRSVVIWAQLGGASWLFMGDMEEEGERDLLKRYPNVKADFLKVGHHGSRTSTTEPFVQHISPKAAFISAGRCNRFGHPHDEVLNQLLRSKTNVYRTDTQGAIQIIFKKQQVQSIRTTRESGEVPPC